MTVRVGGKLSVRKDGSTTAQDGSSTTVLMGGKLRVGKCPGCSSSNVDSRDGTGDRGGSSMVPGRTIPTGGKVCVTTVPTGGK